MFCNKQVITGTCNNVTTGRKMLSPPADIFIYGVHPDTTEEDILAVLAESGIVVDSKSIEMKSKPPATLKSYRISVKAEDLQKALNPAIWPMRVKVREYVYYSKKNTKSGDKGANNQLITIYIRGMIMVIISGYRMVSILIMAHLIFHIWAIITIMVHSNKCMKLSMGLRSSQGWSSHSQVRLVKIRFQ